MIVDDFRTRVDAFFFSSSFKLQWQYERKKKTTGNISDIDIKKNYKDNSSYIYIKINDDTSKQRNVVINYMRTVENVRCWIVH
jgi:hypothetical protein